MKNILFLVLLGALLFTSCGGDDDSVTGTWVATTSSLTSCDDASDNGTEDAFSLTPCTATSPEGCAYASYVFTDNTLTTNVSFTFFGTLSSDVEEGTYTIDGDQMTVCIDGECDTATFTIDGDVMTLISGSDPDDGCVNTVTLMRQ